MFRAFLSVFLLASSCVPVRAQDIAWPWSTPAPASAPQAAATPPKTGTSAYLGAMEGPAEFLAPGASSWTEAKIGMSLPNGTRVRTLNGGSATVAFTDGSKARLGANATLTLEEAAPSKISVYLGLGKLESWVSKVAGSTFQVRNPVAVASVRGAVFGMDVLSPTQATMDVFEGNVAVTDNFGNTASVGAGFRASADAAGGVTAPTPTPPTVKPPSPPPPVVAPPPAAAAAQQAAAPPAEVPAPPPSEAPTAPPQNPLQNISAVSPSSP